MGRFQEARRDMEVAATPILPGKFFESDAILYPTIVTKLLLSCQDIFHELAEYQIGNDLWVLLALVGPAACGRSSVWVVLPAFFAAN